MLEKLQWRLSCSGFISRGGGLWLTSDRAWTLPGPHPWLQAQQLSSQSQASLSIRKRVGLGISSPGGLANLPGSKTYNLWGKTNSTVKVKGKPELHVCAPTDDHINFRTEIISRNSQSHDANSHPWVGHSVWDPCLFRLWIADTSDFSRIAVTSDCSSAVQD